MKKTVFKGWLFSSKANLTDLCSWSCSISSSLTKLFFFKIDLVFLLLIWGVNSLSVDENKSLFPFKLDKLWLKVFTLPIELSL